MNISKQKHPYLKPISKCALIMETDLAILADSGKKTFSISSQSLEYVEFDAKSRFNFFEDDEEDYE